MQSVEIQLENCYGIKKLDTTLDFTDTSVYALYAPNGAMKSSLAKTFQDLAEGVESQDRIFPTRTTLRTIVDEQGRDIESDNVLVVIPYDEELGVGEQTSTLLVDPKLKQEYEDLLRDAAIAKAELLEAIQHQSKTRQDPEVEISDAIMQSPSELDTALGRIESEIHEQTDAPFSDVLYDKIYNEKVLAALDTRDLREAIEEYAQRYDELLSNSTYFKKGTFDYYNAGQIANTLAKNGFFDAEHSVSLNAPTGNREIHNKIELEQVIEEEKTEILTDGALRQKFDKIAGQLTKNVQLRDFYEYVSGNETLLSCLSNPAKLRQDIIKSYIKVHEHLYDNWLSKHRAASNRRSELEVEAKGKSTQWEEVIKIFNDRFFVPFTLETKNKVDVQLGRASIIELGFTYSDGEEEMSVQHDELLQSLSTGERKALYILNVLFEVETRRKNEQESLIIIDDLADSFDYRNKYAIVQYLKDISEYGHFKLLIMTHNFDFLRTIESRFIKYSKCLMALRDEQGVTLEQASGVKNVFARDWKLGFFGDPKKKIACIPFLRNIVEMTTGENDSQFAKLTSMLHWKSESLSITVGDLESIFCKMCNAETEVSGDTKLVYDLIVEQAEDCLAGSSRPNLEDKVVLAIATRLLAEQFVINEIQDPEFVKSITANQTHALIDRYKSTFPNGLESTAVLDRVALMTPESIHLNSFMYEPLIDMSDEHLRMLFSDVRDMYEGSH